MARVLVVDDDLEVRETMASLLRRLKLEHDAVATLEETRECLQGRDYDVVLLDVRLPDGNGLDLLPEIGELSEPPEVVILTGRGDPDGAELAIQRGVWDYLVKPAPIKQISLTLNRALQYHEQKRCDGDVRVLDLAGVVGTSKAMRACYELVAQAAMSDANVLVTGETGSGKELFARTIHANSKRAKQPFVVVDCASLTDNLVESTLFGHKKGAFTGAVVDRVGLVQLADNGVLFLDEVGELPLSIQKAFLRVLQERRFRPVGATREVSSDFRLLAATNRDLEAMAARGEFRDDLLYRVKTMHLHLPALRERKEDIKGLTLSRVDGLCEKYSMESKGFGADFLDMLMAHDWPGNVRELFNVLELAVAAAGKEKNLYAMHLPQELRIKVTKAQLSSSPGASQGKTSPSSFADSPFDASSFEAPGAQELDGPLPSLKEYKERAERRYLARLLQKTGGDVAWMLDISGLSRSHLYALLKKNDLSP